MYTILNKKTNEMMKWELVDVGSLYPVDLIVSKKKGNPVIGTKQRMISLMEDKSKWNNEQLIARCQVVKFTDV